MAGVSNVNTNLTVTNPNQMSLGDMLTMARGAQQYQQASELNPLLIQEAQQKIRSATAEANVSEQTQGSKISKADTEAKSALVGLSSAQVDNLKKHSTLVTQGIQSLMNKPDLTNDDIINAATELNANAGGDEKSLKNSLQGMPTGKDGKPAHPLELKSFLARKLASTLDTQAQIDKLYPTPVNLSLGNKVVPVNTGNQMLTGNVPGSVAGQSNTMGLSPGTTAVAQPGDGTGLEPGTQYIIGSGGLNTQKTNQPGTNQPSAPNRPVATSVSPSFKSQQEIATADFNDVNQRANKAQTNIGILQEIKRLAPIAATGAAADRREMAIKWGQVLGLNIDPATVTTANASDLLKKESSMLAASGGNTDASRVLSEMSNPNSKMTKEAIIKASSQIIAQNKLTLLEQGVKQHFLSNPQDYIKAKTQLDSIKDPRALEYIEMPSDERKNIIASLNTGPNGKALPKGKDGLSDPTRNFLRKVNGLKTLNDKYNLGLF